MRGNKLFTGFKQVAIAVQSMTDSELLRILDAVITVAPGRSAPLSAESPSGHHQINPDLLE